MWNLLDIKVQMIVFFLHWTPFIHSFIQHQSVTTGVSALLLLEIIFRTCDHYVRPSRLKEMQSFQTTWTQWQRCRVTPQLHSSRLHWWRAELVVHSKDRRESGSSSVLTVLYELRWMGSLRVTSRTVFELNGHSCFSHAVNWSSVPARDHLRWTEAADRGICGQQSNTELSGTGHRF